MERYRKLAVDFAKVHGFDSATTETFEKPEGIPAGWEWYVAVVAREPKGQFVRYAPLFDNTPHIIITDGETVMWRTLQDAITLES